MKRICKSLCCWASSAFAHCDVIRCSQWGHIFLQIALSISLESWQNHQYFQYVHICPINLHPDLMSNFSGQPENFLGSRHWKICIWLHQHWVFLGQAPVFFLIDGTKPNCFQVLTLFFAPYILNPIFFWVVIKTRIVGGDWMGHWKIQNLTYVYENPRHSACS